jgi:hypothetical protein
MWTPALSRGAVWLGCLLICRSCQLRCGAVCFCLLHVENVDSGHQQECHLASLLPCMHTACVWALLNECMAVPGQAL